MINWLRGLPDPQHPTRRAFKVTTIVVSTLAALTSVVSFAHSYGLIGARPPAYLTVGDLGVGWVSVTPAADTVAAIGDTIHLAATVTDKQGSSLVGATLAWSSGNPSVASVDSHGQVVARAPGAATIVASAGDHLARARIVVHQLVARVRIMGDSVVTVGEGARHQVQVRVMDGRNFVVAGRPVAWRTTDNAVAVVDSAGVVTGRATGRTSLVATVDGVSGHAELDVHPVPASLALESDSTLSAAAGTRLAQPLVVHVTSELGQPAAGVIVHFAIQNGQGHVEPASAHADLHGDAKATWTLGPLPGRQHLVATVEGLDSTLMVTAEAEPVPANTHYAWLGDALEGRAGEPLPEPLTVQLTDTLGRVMADVPVAWSAEDGGSVAAMEARTDSLGITRAAWTLGPRTGRQRVRVQAGRARTVPPFFVTATATAGPPAAASIVSGNAQTARAGTALAKPIRLRVVDAAGNRVAGARVMVLAAAGTTPDTLLTTDSTGTVRIRWTLGRSAGSQQMLARPEGVPQALTITAVARARVPANIEFVTAPDSGRAGRALSEPITVAVRDLYGNPIADATVHFAVRTGRVSARTSVTDANGRASTRWTLGRAHGEQVLTVSVPKTDVRAELTVEAGASGTSSR